MAKSERVAVVTGGAHGLGLATAERLLRDAYRVAMVDIQPELPDEARSSLTGEWQYFSADVSDRDAVQSISDAITSAWGRVDALVNNAGIFPRVDSLEMTDEEWDRILKVNLGGTFLCCQVFGRGMLDNGSGVIINTASGHAIRGAPRGAAYAASKAGIIALTRTLATEWAPAVRVN